MYQLCFYVPEEDCEAVKAALFAAGAGRIGDYEACAWQVMGEGQFRPLPGSAPHLGRTGELERVREVRVEMACADEHIATALRALRAAHPYEEPAFHAWRVETDAPNPAP